MVYCVVPGCRNGYERGDRHFFKFPSNPAQMMRWLKSIRRKDWTPKASSRICSWHFPNGWENGPTRFAWNVESTDGHQAVKREASEDVPEMVPVTEEDDANLQGFQGDNGELQSEVTSTSLNEAMETTSPVADAVTVRRVADHYAEMCRVLQSFRQSGFLCDTVIRASDGEAKAHGVVLAAVSSAFKATLDTGDATCVPCIEVLNCDLATVEIALQFIYSGKLILPQQFTRMDSWPALFASLNHLGLTSSQLNGCEVVRPQSEENPHTVAKSSSRTDCYNATESNCRINTSVDHTVPVKDKQSLDIGSWDRNCDEITEDFNEPSSTDREHCDRRLSDSSALEQNRDDGLSSSADIVHNVLSNQKYYRRSLKLTDATVHKKAVRIGYRSKKSKESWLCPICGKAYASKCGLHDHSLSHTQEKPYACDICNKVFSLSSNLARHKNVIHRGIRPHMCDVCGMCFGQKKSLQVHMEVHKGRPAYTCPSCEVVFYKQVSLDRHVRKQHTALSTDSNSRTAEAVVSKSYLCDLCGKSFMSAVSLRLHSVLHGGKHPYSCTVCESSFVLRSQLNMHMRRHTDVKQYLCGVCGKAFKYKDGLMQHKRIHAGFKPFACNVCDNRFTQAHHLACHMLTHTGEKPYACSFCDKKYKNSRDLQTHSVRIHGVSS